MWAMIISCNKEPKPLQWFFFRTVIALRFQIGSLEEFLVVHQLFCDGLYFYRRSPHINRISIAVG
jgi:hypothetical protein